MLFPEIFLILPLIPASAMLKNKRFSKIIMIIFLIMIVVGFTVPLFNLDNTQAQQQATAEPRLCQNDADCYLLCNDKPVEVLCSQNLCQQNGCEEAAIYPYTATPITFDLKIKVEGKEINLVNRSNSKDLFVQFKDSTVSVHSFEFPLALILEKLSIGLTSECLFLGKGPDNRYCNTEQKQLRLLVNGEESFRYGELVPAEGDKVEIEYN